MSSQMNEENTRWSAKRKSALVLEIIGVVSENGK